MTTYTDRTLATTGALHKHGESLMDAQIAALTARVAALETPLTPPVTPLPTPPATPPVATVPLTYVAGPSIPAQPAILGSVKDPTWGGTVTHVSAARHAYARIQPWNADGSRLLLGYVPSAAHLLDGTTYADLKTLQVPSYALWSNVDPNKLYGANGNLLVTQDPRTGTFTTLHDFGATVSIGNYEGGISDGDEYLALSAGGRLFVWDLVANKEHASIPLPAGLDNFQISRKGTYLVTVGADGTVAYPANLTSFRRLTTTSNHGDNALDASGKEIYVGCNANEFGGTEVIAFDLATGTRTVLASGSAFEYGHVSGRGPAGFVTLSDYGTTQTTGRPGWDQIVSLRTDGSGQAKVWCFANHVGDDGSAAAYQRQPHAVPSRDGARVLFASEWGQSIASAWVVG